MNKGNKYDLPDGLNNRIVQYCLERIKSVQGHTLSSNNIKKNIFLELMYDRAVERMHEEGDIAIDDEDIKKIFLSLKNSEIIFSKFIDGECDLVGVKDNDYLIFRLTK